MAHWIYRISNPTVRLLLFLFSRWEVKGKENVPRSGPVIVVANHMTMVDPPMLSVSLGRYAQIMAKEELFRTRFTNYIMSGLGAFPVHRGRLDRQALRIAEKALSDGGVLMIFPEGQRSRSGKLQKASAGATLIALRNGVPILPVGITGTERVSGIRSVLHRPRLTVNIGKPFHLPIAKGKEDRVARTDYLMKHIAEVLPEEYRGIYGSRETP
ncbi:MAG TPA: 1-acyl-sn-glycerol-3-phosphate acyltransferase [Dehalococcoidia bacterium]|nr:1-acyl-sn-glycerol-3-phosphate acyltransferase [Dehalococcoidia bacterium]